MFAGTYRFRLSASAATPRDLEMNFSTMHKSARIMAFGACATLAFACVACSPDPIIWGSDGAQVRAVTDQIIEDVETSGSSTKICSDANVDLGASTAWKHLAAGEPEQYTGDQWEKYADIDPTWLINLSSTDTQEADGSREVPAYLFYRGSGDELCVAAIEWGELATTP